MKVKTNKTCQL